MKIYLSIKKIVLFISFCAILSCEYTPDSLPKHVVADYEIAFPIADTTLSLSNIKLLSGQTKNTLIIPAGKKISHTMSFPFYLSDFTDEGHYVEWVEPKAIIANNIYLDIDYLISFYIESSDGSKFIFASDKSIVQGDNYLFGDENSRVSRKNFSSLDKAGQLFITITLITKKNILIKDFIRYNSHIKFGLKAMVKMGFSL